MTPSADLVAQLEERVADLEQLLEVQTRVAVEHARTRARAHERLSQSEANFAALVEQLPDAVFVEQDGVVRYANASMALLLGYEVGAIVGSDCRRFLHADDRAAAVGYDQRVDQSERPPPIQVRWVRKDGGLVVVERSRRWLTYDGKPAALVFARDVTETLRIQTAHVAMGDELRQSEARLRVLFEMSPVAKLLFERDSLQILAANHAAAELYGYSIAELLTLRLSDLRPLGDPCVAHDMSHVRSDAAMNARWGGVKRHRRKDGRLVDVEITSHPVAVDGGRARLAAVVDVTEKRHLEEQLRHAQKMDAVGQLAGGIAHDFNNLLSVILSYATLLLQDIEPENPIFADLTEVRLAGERAASLTRQLLAFSRKQILEPRDADLNDLIAGMEKMLRRLLGETVALSFTPAEGLGQVYVDRGQIEQVVMNLVVNARDASGPSGRVSIDTENVLLDEAYAAANPGVRPGRFVRMTVADDGRGMDRATLDRIFEPFFTTKGKDKGTGLGLSTVFGIVQQSGGHIRVESQVGKGSTFQLYFPRMGAGSGRVTSPSLPSKRVPGRTAGETILLVEDEEQVRRSVGAILWRQGYTVLEAQNGGEAFMICERHGGPIHLLVTDVVMPVMNGREVAERLAPMRPDMRVLYMSGYTEHSIVREGALEPGLAFLQKPVTPDSLVRKVRAVLGRDLRS